MPELSWEVLKLARSFLPYQARADAWRATLNPVSAITSTKWGIPKMAISDLPAKNAAGAALIAVGTITMFGTMFKASVLGFYPSESLGIMVAIGVAMACLLIGIRLLRTPLPPAPRRDTEVRPAPHKTDLEITQEAEAAARAQSERERKEAELRENFAKSGDSLLTLLADPVIAKEAREVRRIYDRSTCLSFLKRKAAELGLDEVNITEDQLPETF